MRGQGFPKSNISHSRPGGNPLFVQVWAALGRPPQKIYVHPRPTVVLMVQNL
jgi:hypothetical protein